MAAAQSKTTDHPPSLSITALLIMNAISLPYAFVFSMDLDKAGGAVSHK
jgi:hypothetical protein